MRSRFVTALLILVSWSLPVNANEVSSQKPRIAMTVNTVTSNFETYRNRSRQLRDQGQIGKAISVIAKVVMLPEAQSCDFKLAGDLYNRINIFRIAANMFRRAAELDDKDAECKVRAVECLLAQGDYVSAREYVSIHRASIDDPYFKERFLQLDKIAIRGAPQRMRKSQRGGNSRPIE